MSPSQFCLSLKHIFLATAFVGGTLPAVVWAQSPGFYKGIAAKQTEKTRSRWTLIDWMAQKRDVGMMDLWLAKNSYSSPFEFYLDGSLNNYNLVNAATPSEHRNLNSQGGEFGAFAGRAGLRGVYRGDEENRVTWMGGFNFRIYGRAIQDTHINLEYGLRGLTLPSPSPEKFQNQFAAVHLTIYLTKHLGIEGSHTRILPARSDLENTLEGETSAGKLFIDFSAVRFYGEWRNELLRTKSATSATSETRSGYGGGIRLFF